MPGIIPDVAAGAVITRDGNGTCLFPANVSNAYCPPAAFTSTCDISYLPSGCDARTLPSQINGFMSEMLSFAACLNPTGEWNCTSLQNLCTNFTAWTVANKVVDGETILGAGTLADPWRVDPDNIVAAICGDATAAGTLAGCLLSADAGNTTIQGTDNLLFTPIPTIDAVTLGGGGVAGNPFRVVPLGTVNAICGSAAAKTALIDCILSGDAGNTAVVGGDGGVFVPAGTTSAGDGDTITAAAPFAIIPLGTAEAICADDAARQALAACTLSTDANNSVILGTDGLHYYRQGITRFFGRAAVGTAVNIDVAQANTVILTVDTPVNNVHPTRNMLGVATVTTGAQPLRLVGSGRIQIVTQVSTDGGATFPFSQGRSIEINGVNPGALWSNNGFLNIATPQVTVPAGTGLTITTRMVITVEPGLEFDAGSLIEPQLTVQFFGTSN